MPGKLKGSDPSNSLISSILQKAQSIGPDRPNNITMSMMPYWPDAEFVPVGKEELFNSLRQIPPAINKIMPDITDIRQFPNTSHWLEFIKNLGLRK